MFGLRRSNSSSSKGNKKSDKSSRTPSLTESAIRAVANEDEWEDLDGKSEIRSRVSSRSEKKGHKKSRSRSRSKDRKRKDGDKREVEKRKDKQAESTSGSSRAARNEKTRGAEDFASDMRKPGFDEFPGQYDQPYGLPQSAPRPLSPHIQSQFPGQFPTDYSHNAFGNSGKTTSEGGYGLAADYYGDQGQSVGMQPGVRPPSPEIKFNHAPHLQPASSVPTPAQDTGNGAAADFYGTNATPAKPSKQSSSSKPLRPQNGPFVGSNSDQPGPPSSMSDAASFYTAAGITTATWPQHNGAGSGYNAGSSEAYYAPPRPAQHEHGHSSAFPTAAETGAAGLAAGAYAAHHHGQGPSPMQVNHPQEDQFTYRPPSSNGRPTAHTHRHKRRGPLDRFFDLVQNKEDVRRMEEYTEWIGVCKYCFDPHSSARDAPRPHHFHRRRSSDSFKRRRSNESLRQTARRKGKHSGVDKDARYRSSSSSDSDGKRKSKAGWLGAGLASYGIAKVGEAIWNQKHDFNDGHSARTGRSDRPPSYQSKGSDISRGVVRPSGRNEHVYSQNPDALTVRHPEPVRSPRSRSREQRGHIAGPSHAGHSHPNGAFIRRRSRTRSRSRSPGLGEIFGVTAPKSKQKSPVNKKKSKQKGFFNFGNASTSSSESGLAFGSTLNKRKSSPRRRSRRNSRDHLDTTLMGIGATAAALAAAQSRRRPEVVAVKERSDKRNIRNRGGVLGRQSSVDEEGWESVTESDASNASSGLAFGDLHYDKGKRPARRSSRESLSSQSSGTGKWGWRWGRSEQKRETPRKQTTQTVDVRPALSGRGPSYSSPAQPIPIRPADVASVVSSAAMGPMQVVDPMPLTDSPSIASAPRYEPPSDTFYARDVHMNQQDPQLTQVWGNRYNQPVDSERRKDKDRPQPPAPRRSQSDPPNHGLRDAAIFGGAAAAAAGIHAASRSRKDESDVRFEDERRVGKGLRDDRRRDDRDSYHDAEAERERAHESERTRSRREAAEQKAYDRARENERQAIADRAEHDSQYNMSGALPSPAVEAPPSDIQPSTTALSERERQLEALIAAKKRELAERHARGAETASTPPPPYPGHDVPTSEPSSHVPETGYYTQTFTPTRRDTEDEAYSPDTPEDLSRGRSGVEYSDSARTTAARVVADLKEKYTSPQPTQAEFFAPKELEKKPVLSEEEERRAMLKEWVPNADADIHYTMHANDFKRFDPKTQFLIRRDGVPHLGLIVPTPPVSMAGSVKGDKSPVSPQMTSDRETPKQATERSKEEKAANRVSWGPDDTRFYEIESPAHSPRIPPAGSMPSDPVIEVKSDERGEPSQNYRFSDLPSAAEPFIAKSLTGEPEVIEVIRDRPTSSTERRGVYQSPFFETVSDLGLSLDSPGTEGAPPVRGFIEGEVEDPTPMVEKSAYIPASFEDRPPPTVYRDTKPASRETSQARDTKQKIAEEDPVLQSWSSLPPRSLPREDKDFDTRSETWDTGLSKKDKKRKDKAAKREIVDFASEPAMSERASSVVGEPLDISTTTDDVWEKPLTKKEQRKRDKLTRRNTEEELADAAESVPVAPVVPISTKVEEEEFFEAPLSKKDKKRKDKLTRQSTDDIVGEVETPAEPSVEAENPWEPPLSRKEQKKREKLARQNTDDLASPMDTPSKQPPDFVVKEAPVVVEWQVPLSKKEQKKRDKLARQNTDDFSTPVESPISAKPADDEWQVPLSKKEQKKRDKLVRQNTDDLDKPVETPVAESSAQDDWQVPLSKKEQKKRDKLARQNTDDFSTPVEVPIGSAPAEDEWQVPLSNKEQKKRDKLARQNTDEFLSEDVAAPSESPTKIEQSEPAWEAPLSKKDKKKLEKERRRSGTENVAEDHSTRNGYAASESGDRRQDDFDARDTRSEPGERRESKQSFGDIATALLAGGAVGFAANEITKSRSDDRDERDASKAYSSEKRKDLSRSPPPDTGSSQSRDSRIEEPSAGRGLPGSFDESERFEIEEERRARKKKSRQSGDFDDNMSMVSGYSERSSKSKRDKDDSSSKKDKKGGLFGMFRRKSEDVNHDDQDDRDDKRDKKHHKRRGTGDDDDTRSVTSGISRRSTADYGDVPSETKRERRRDRDGESPTERLLRQSTSSKEELRKRDRSGTLTGQDVTEDQSFLAKRVEVEELRSLPAEHMTQPSRAPETVNPSSSSNELGGNAAQHEDLRREAVISPESPTSQSPFSETPRRPSILPLRPASATAVPIRFRRPPVSPAISTASTPNVPRARAESFSSQVPASPDSPASLVTPRTRASRPRSTEIRREFQPLYLVEHNRKPSEIVLENEPLPPLPVSRETSRASSLRGSDGYESAVEDQLFEDAVETPLPVITAEDEFVTFDSPVERTIEVPSRFEDVLSSNQSTPRASAFPADAFGKKVKREPEFYSWEDMLREEREREARAAEDTSEHVPQPQGAPTVSNGLHLSTIAGTAAISAGAPLALDALTTSTSSNDRLNTSLQSSDDGHVPAVSSTFRASTPPAVEPESVFATPLEEPNISFPTPIDQSEPAFTLKPARKGSKKKGKPLKLGTAVITGDEAARETAEEMQNRAEKDTQDALEGLFGETESPGKEWRERRGRKGSKGKKDSVELKLENHPVASSSSKDPVQQVSDAADPAYITVEAFNETPISKHLSTSTQDKPKHLTQSALEPSIERTLADDQPANVPTPVTAIEQPAKNPTQSAVVEKPAQALTSAEDDWSPATSKSDKKRKGKKGKGVKFDIWNDEQATPEATSQPDSFEAQQTEPVQVDTPTIIAPEEQITAAPEEQITAAPEPSFQPTLSKKELKKLKKGKKADPWAASQINEANILPEVEDRVIESNVESTDLSTGEPTQAIEQSRETDLQPVVADEPSSFIQPAETEEWSKPLSKKELKKLKKGKKVDLWSEDPSPAIEDKQISNDDADVGTDMPTPSAPRDETVLDVQPSQELEQSAFAPDAPIRYALTQDIKTEAWSKPLSKKELKKLKKGKKVDPWSEEPSPAIEDKELTSNDAGRSTTIADPSYESAILDVSSVREQESSAPIIEGQAQEPETEAWSKPLSKKELKKLKKGKKVDLWSEEPIPVEENDDQQVSLEADNNAPETLSATETHDNIAQESFIAEHVQSSISQGGPSQEITEPIKILSKKELKKLKKGKKVDIWSDEPSPAVESETKQMIVDDDPAQDSRHTGADSDQPSASFVPETGEPAPELDEWSKPLSKKELKKLKRGKKPDIVGDEPLAGDMPPTSIAEAGVRNEELDDVANTAPISARSQPEMEEPESKALDKAERKKLKKGKKYDPWAFDDDADRVKDVVEEQHDINAKAVLEPSAQAVEEQVSDSANIDNDSHEQESLKSRDYWGIMAGAVAGAGATVAALTLGGKAKNDSDTVSHDNTPSKDTDRSIEIQDKDVEATNSDAIVDRSSSSDGTRSKSVEPDSRSKRSKSKDEKRKSATSAVLSWVLPSSGSKSKRDKDKKSKRSSSSKSRETAASDDDLDESARTVAPVDDPAQTTAEPIVAKSLATEPLWGPEDVVRDESDRFVNVDPDAPPMEQLAMEVSHTTEREAHPESRDEIQFQQGRSAPSALMQPRDYSNLWGEDDLARDESSRMRGDMDDSNATDLIDVVAQSRVVRQQGDTLPPVRADVEQASSTRIAKSTVSRDLSQPLWGNEDVVRDESARLSGAPEDDAVKLDTQDISTNDKSTVIDERQTGVPVAEPDTTEIGAEPASDYFVVKKSKKDKKRNKGGAVLNVADDTKDTIPAATETPVFLGMPETPQDVAVSNPQPVIERSNDLAFDVGPNAELTQSEAVEEDTWNVPVKKRKGKKGKRAEAAEVEPVTESFKDEEASSTTQAGVSVKTPLIEDNTLAPVVTEVDRPKLPDVMVPETATDDDWGFTPLKKRKGKKGKRAEAEVQASKTLDEPVENVKDSNIHMTNSDTAQIDNFTRDANLTLDDPTATQVQGPKTGHEDDTTDPVSDKVVDPLGSDELEQPPEAAPEDEWSFSNVKKGKKGKKGKRATGLDLPSPQPVIEEVEPVPTTLRGQDAEQQVPTEELWAPASSKSKKKGRKAALAAASVTAAAGGALALEIENNDKNSTALENSDKLEESRTDTERPNEDVPKTADDPSPYFEPSPAELDRPLERMVMPPDLRDLPPTLTKQDGPNEVEPAQSTPDGPLESMKMPEDLRDLPPIRIDVPVQTSLQTSAVPTPLGDWDIDPLLDSNIETPDEMWAKMTKKKKSKKSKRGSAIGTPLSKEMPVDDLPIPFPVTQDEKTLQVSDQRADVEQEPQAEVFKSENFRSVDTSCPEQPMLTVEPIDIATTPAKRTDSIVLTESPIQEVGISRFKESPPRDTESDTHRQQSSHVSSEGNTGIMGVDRMPLTRAPSELLEDERQPLLSRNESPERAGFPVAVPVVESAEGNAIKVLDKQNINEQPANTTDVVAQEPGEDEWNPFSLKVSKKDKKKAKKQKRQTLDLAADESPVKIDDVSVQASTNTDSSAVPRDYNVQGRDQPIESLPQPRSSVPDRFRLSRPLSKFDWADEVEAAGQVDEPHIESAIQPEPDVPVVPSAVLPENDTSAVDPESEFTFTRKLSKKEKRKGKKGKKVFADEEATTSQAHITPEDSVKNDYLPGSETPVVPEPSSSRPRTPSQDIPKSPSRDIDFAATLAAGLAQSGFNSDMVIDDPNYHRRSSPPGTVAEADPEEAFAIVNKKGRKGKKGRKLVAETPVEPATEQNTIAEVGTEVSEYDLKTLNTADKNDDFAAALTAGLGAAGFSAALISRSQEDLAKNDEPEESMFTKSSKKKRKGKKIVDLDADDMDNEVARKAVELAGDDSLDIQAQEASKLNSATLQEGTPAMPGGIEVVQEAPEEDEWALSSKKVKKGKGKKGRAIDMEPKHEPKPAETAVVETPLPDLPSKKQKKKRRGSAFDWNAETPTGNIPEEKELSTKDQSYDEAPMVDTTPAVGLLHTSEISQNVPTAVRKPLKSADRSMDVADGEKSTASLKINDASSWSFDVLDKNRDSGVAESPILPDDDKNRDTIRDSGYDTITDRSNRDSGEKYDVPETILETGMSDLNADRGSVASWEEWDMPVKKTRSPEADTERLTASGRGPSPVESTTKNRTSYLFSTPPTDNKQFSETAKPKSTGKGEDRSVSPASKPVIPLDYVPQESPERKRGKAISDVGQPAHAIKSTRTNDDVKQTFRERMDSSARGLPGLALRDDHSAVPSTSQTRLEALRSPTGLSNTSASSLQRLKSPDPIRAPSITASIISNESTTPSLRRTDRSVSGDLRAAARRGDSSNLGSADAQTNNSIPPFRAPPTPPLNDDERRVNNSRGMSDFFEGYGDGEPMATSPTRPQSIRRKQSMYIADMEARVDALVAENQRLQETRGDMDIDANDSSIQKALADSEMKLREKDAEINQIKTMLEPLKQELAQLKDLNANLSEANKNLIADTNDRYGTLQEEHSYANAQWQQSVRELEKLRHEHSQLSSGMETIVRQHIDTALEDKDNEIARLRAELDYATSEIRALQARIQATASDDYLTVRDEDYFDSACQKLCQHVQAWVLRFSKSSDNRACRLSSDLKDDKLETRLDNTMLDGSDVDTLLVDRVRRRDVFMALVMMMVWEYIFTRYLFGMDREQRQKLKALEKILLEVGPPRAVAQWRATTLTLLSRRPAFSTQKNLDHEAVTQEVYSTLAALLPPPKTAEGQLMAGLKKVLRLAIDLSIEMRTQRADYFMLPPPTPEYDGNGDLVGKTRFDAATMNERSGEYASNEELQSTGSVVKIVLFPLVMKKGDDSGEGGEEVVICPAQVLVATSKHSKRVVRRRSGVMDVDENESRGTGARSRMSLMSGGGEGFI
ncbi:Hypothetical protein D9617_4g003900 [Elsinoe fawcettii]|nr:Hypothetical protein D9617_4g003900 [Elsinoe fawcettii]